MELIDGKAIAQEIKIELKDRMARLDGRQPGLAIILVGNRPDSEIYVRLKESFAKEIGMENHLYKFPEGAEEEEIIKTIDHLNSDEDVDAILVQLPLPKEIDADRIIRRINPKKDADGFHPANLDSLMSGCDKQTSLPVIFQSILIALERVGCDLNGKEVAILANSDIFGKSLEKVLQYRGAKAIKFGPGDSDFIEKVRKADILISAIGKAHLLTGDLIKEGSTVIDIGITKKGKKVLGDVDTEAVKKKKGFVTPVPGGIGPITVAMLFKKTLELYEKNQDCK